MIDAGGELAMVAKHTPAVQQGRSTTEKSGELNCRSTFVYDFEIETTGRTLSGAAAYPAMVMLALHQAICKHQIEYLDIFDSCS
jgi:hypothetical protein